MTIGEGKQPKGSGIVVKDFSSFCEGDIDRSLNKKIRTLIDVTHDYIVYLDDDFFVQWSFTDAYEKKLPDSFGAIANRLRYLETLSRTPLRKSQVEAFAGLLAEAMARIVGDKDEAKAREVLDKAEHFLVERGKENARHWYVSGSAAAALPTLLIACALWLMRSWAVEILGVNAFEVLVGALVGGTGALFSILSRTEKIHMDATAGSFIHYVESASRVLVGNIGALVMALAVKANVLLGFTQSKDYSFALLLVVCACAGASERSVSGFIRKMETSIGSDAKKT